MEKYSISVLGADKKQYEIADFRARGMNYTNAIGIIVTTEFMSRILAFDTWQEQWGNTDRILTEEQNESVAMQTFSGLDLTKRIVEAQTDIDGMTAAKRCWNYQKGGLQWYLPCLMELGVLCAYRDEINKAMKEIGCPDECFLQKILMKLGLGVAVRAVSTAAGACTLVMASSATASSTAVTW